MFKKNVLIIFGGYSSEYPVSCSSAAGVIEYIDRTRFNVFKLGITLDGQWLLTDAEANEIADSKTWLNNPQNLEAIISPNRDRKELLIFDKDSVRTQSIDCVLPLIHGYGGEDGRLQGLLDLANIPYVGSGVIASANAMDKAVSGIFSDVCGIKRPSCEVIYKSDFVGFNDNKAKELNLNYPVFVKPANSGSSVGVSKAADIEDLIPAVKEALLYDDKVIIEQMIKGKEIKVAILEESDTNELLVGELCEITMPDGGINDYDTKYINHTSVKKIPAETSEQTADLIKAQAKMIFRKLECKGFARVDFFLTDDGDIYFNEINTVPGFGKNSIYSLMFEAKGIPYSEIIARLIDNTLIKTHI